MTNLQNFTLDKHIKKLYWMISSPLIVKYDMLKRTKKLPKFEEDLFKRNENFYTYNSLINLKITNF